MIIENKLDKAFGPFASSTGFFMLFGGMLATYFAFWGILIAITGAFISFTTTSTLLDIKNKKAKCSNNLFGIIPAGKWIDLTPGMKLGLKKSHRGYVGYIMGTQPVGIHYNDIRIVLYGQDNKKIMDVQKFTSLESSRTGLSELSSDLGLAIKPQAG